LALIKVVAVGRKHLVSAFVLSLRAQSPVHQLYETMAFPGMSAPGLSGDASLDEQKLKEQQMIKYVRMRILAWYL
jgi:hypothetical protein